MRYPFNSLEDFLISTLSTVDAQLDDGWGALFPVKGREIEATILFADIAAFSRRTLSLSPTETLIFANNFFAWITAEALHSRKGIVDKYIGDEVMVVFSKEFGSDDPFVDAVQAARRMCDNDFLDFCPHIGIASGQVIVGYVGTPIRYNCSVFGHPVALAARCAGIKPAMAGEIRYSSSIIFPTIEWNDRSFSDVFPFEKLQGPNGEIIERRHGWEMLEKRPEAVKNMPVIEITAIINKVLHRPMLNAEDRAREALRNIKKAGRYWVENAT